MLFQAPMTPLCLEPKFPQKLVHQIIDDVAQMQQTGTVPPSTLMSCSLTCRAWLPRSRYHLFHNVSLSDRRNPEPFLKLLKSKSRLGSIAPYVQCLFVVGYGVWVEPWFNNSLLRLTVLTALESLHIQSNHFENLGNVAITKFFSSFVQLKTMHLDCCSFCSSDQISLILSATAHLQYLELRYVELKPSSTRARLKNLIHTTMVPRASFPSQRIPSHLRILNITSSEFMKEIIQCLQSGDEISPVNTLQLKIDSGDDITVYTKLVRMLGSSLTDLAIDCLASGFDYLHVVADDLDLTSLDALRILRLPLIHCDPDYIQRAINTVYILAKITSPCIEEVFIKVKYCCLEELDCIDWDAVGRIFARPNFSQLKRVVLLVEVTFPGVGLFQARRQTLSWLAMRLPAYYAKGIFDVLNYKVTQRELV